MILCQLKPFPNKIGDTFQTKIGNMYIYCEQTTDDYYHFYIKGEGFKIYGYLELKMVIYINSTTVENIGSYTIEYDDGIKHRLMIPKLLLSGTGMGERTLKIEGKLYIIDEVSNTY